MIPTSSSSPPTKVQASSVADFQFGFQALTQQPFPSIPKTLSIPQPLTRLSPQPIPASLFLPTSATAPEVGKKQAQGRCNKVNKSRNPSNDKVKKRLARKAELARASRRRKKAYVQDLEDKVNRLTQQVLALQRERTLLGLSPSPSNSLMFTSPLSISPSRLHKSISDGNDSSDGGENNEKDKMNDSENNGSESGLSDNVMIDGLSGLATAASSLASMESMADILLTKGGKANKSSNSTGTNGMKTEEEEEGENSDQGEEEMKPKPKKSPQPAGFTIDPNLPLSVLALQQSQPSVPIPRSLTVTTTPHSPPLSTSLLSTSRVSAFTDTRVKQESGSSERCIKASYLGDTRRFSLTQQNFNYPTLVQTLRETYQNLPSSFTIKYCDEEQDYINITTTAEFREAYRLLCLPSSSLPVSPISSSSTSSSTSTSTSTSSTPKVLRLIIENNTPKSPPTLVPPTPAGKTRRIKNGSKNSGSTTSSRRKTKLGKRKNSPPASLTTISPTTTTTASSPPQPNSPLLKKHRGPVYSLHHHRDLPFPSGFPSTSFPILVQGLENIPETNPLTLIVDSSMTIEQLKNDIAKMQQPVPAGVYYRFSHQGQILDDNNKYIKDYGITKGSIIRLDRLEIAGPPLHANFVHPLPATPLSTSTTTTMTTSTTTTTTPALTLTAGMPDSEAQNPLSFFFPHLLPLLSATSSTPSSSIIGNNSTVVPAITSGFSFPHLQVEGGSRDMDMKQQQNLKQGEVKKLHNRPRGGPIKSGRPKNKEQSPQQSQQQQCSALVQSKKYPPLLSSTVVPVLLGA